MTVSNSTGRPEGLWQEKVEEEEEENVMAKQQEQSPGFLHILNANNHNKRAKKRSEDERSKPCNSGYNSSED